MQITTKTKQNTNQTCLILCFHFIASLPLKTFLSYISPTWSVPIFLFVNLLPASSISDKPQCFVQAALPGDTGPEPQQPGEPLPKLFLWPPAGWSRPQPQQLPGVRHGGFCRQSQRWTCQRGSVSQQARISVHDLARTSITHPKLKSVGKPAVECARPGRTSAEVPQSGWQPHLTDKAGSLCSAERSSAFIHQWPPWASGNWALWFQGPPKPPSPGSLQQPKTEEPEPCCF